MSEENEQLVKTPGPLGENFMLERELGRGGMGGVYLGRDVMLDRPVAVKVMQKQYGKDEEFLAKFKKEAQAAAKLIHPNIAQIYSYGVVEDMPYIAMELVAGGSLDQVMRNAKDGKTDIPRVLKICEQVAQALRCAADQGLVHGDIKPENILLDSNGNAKLVDFGLAGMQKDTTEIWGTPYYIAPEKLKKEIVDYRADMYNLGGTLYHALTGVAPFEGPDAAAVVRKRFEGMPKKPSQVRSDVPSAVDALVMKMLAFDKNDRYPTFEALLEAFKGVMATGLTADADKGAQKNGTRRMTVRTGRRLTSAKMTTGKMTTAKITTSKVNLDGSGDYDGPTRTSRIPTRFRNGEDEQPEEEGGNPIKKMLFGVGGGILVIALIIGGLVWYQIADKKAREEAKQASIVLHINEARDTIAKHTDAAKKFEREFDEFAAKATAECESATKKISAAVPEYASRLKPAMSKELLDAIAMTNLMASAIDVNTVSNAMNQMAKEMAGAMQQMANQMSAAMTAAVKTSAKASKMAVKASFRPPTEDEMDPASPEYEEYQRQKREWEANQGKGGSAETETAQDDSSSEESAGEQSSEEVASAEEAPADESASGDPNDPANKLKANIAKLEAAKKTSEAKFKRELNVVGEEAVRDVNDLWTRAYSCQASVIKIKLEIQKILTAAAEADGYKDYSEPSMNKLVEISNKVGEMIGTVTASPEVENVRKGITYIKSKGEKSLRLTSDNLFRRRAEYDRELKKIDYDIEKLHKEYRTIIDRRELVAKEQAQAADKFEALLQNKNFEMLEWDSAIREIEFLKSGFKTPEGAIAADEQLKKVKAMKSVQEIIVRNLVGYQFRKSKLLKLKATVREVDMKEMKVAYPDPATKKDKILKINWVTFYKSYHANFNELIIQFIENGRKNGNPKLTLQEWGDAMCGAALTLHLVCADDPAAAARGEQIAKEVAKNFPDYVKTLRMMFPDITFDDVQSEDL